MNRQIVVSSMMRSVGYEPENLTLEVEFKRGDVWRYAPVRPATYAAMIDPTASAGRILNADVLRNPNVVGEMISAGTPTQLDDEERARVGSADLRGATL
jgi:hypothetical protein